MKIQLLYAVAQIGKRGELIIHGAGDIVDFDDYEAKTLVEQGQAVALDEPEPVPVKRVPKKVI